MNPCCSQTRRTPRVPTVIAENYEGGSVDDDWTGEVTFQSPDPACRPVKG